jgi:hypothetical protein
MNCDLQGIGSLKRDKSAKIHLPSQEEEHCLDPPGSAIHVVPVEDEEALLGGEPGVLEQEHDVVELAVDVPDDDDGLARPRVDADEVGLLVEPGGGGDDQPLDDRRREHGRELVRGEVARAPVQSGGQPRHPVPRQPAVLGPLDRKRPKRREWGRIRRGGGAVGLRHGMRRIRRVGFGFLSSFCSSFFISSLFFLAANCTDGLGLRVPVGSGGCLYFFPPPPAYFSLLWARVTKIGGPQKLGGGTSRRF